MGKNQQWIWKYWRGAMLLPWSCKSKLTARWLLCRFHVSCSSTEFQDPLLKDQELNFFQPESHFTPVQWIKKGHAACSNLITSYLLHRRFNLKYFHCVRLEFFGEILTKALHTCDSSHLPDSHDMAKLNTHLSCHIYTITELKVTEAAMIWFEIATASSLITPALYDYCRVGLKFACRL